MREARQFTATNEGQSRLGLRDLCERFVNDLWIPAHLTDEQALDFAVDYFKGRFTRS